MLHFNNKSFSKTFRSIFFLSLFLFSQYACDTTEPPINKTTISLKLEDVSCTEAWVQFSGIALQLPNALTLYINNQPKGKINLTTTDTLLYIDSLLPNQTYKIIAVMQQSNNRSNELTLTTMDTTSHNFTWQTWTFGNASAGSSVLYDVAIIDENNIWAVGEIYMLDSLGRPDPNAYNAVHWDGSKWELRRIKTNACGGVVYSPIQTIFAFSAEDILFAHIDGSISHFDGIEFNNDCSLITQLDGSVNKIWGRAKDDFYVVSNFGFVAYYNGNSWNRIESGSDLHISDIYGSEIATGKFEILCVASDYSIDRGKKVLKISGNDVQEINNDGLPWSLNGIWFIPNRKYFVVGDGFYSAKNLGAKWVRDLSIPPYYKTGIRGDSYNNIAMVGAYGLFMHFNGYTWKTLFEMPYLQGSYGEVKVRGNIIVCTGGLNNNKAIITIGRR